MTLRSLRAATVAGALALSALGTAGVAAADDPYAVPAPILDTTCTLDQLMAGTQAVTPMVYQELLDKYNSEPPWIQGGVVYHLNRLLQKTPPERQAEIDTLAGFFPDWVPLFVMTEPIAEQIAAKCPTYPPVNPAVWNPAPPAPPAPAPPAS